MFEKLIRNRDWDGVAVDYCLRCAGAFFTCIIFGILLSLNGGSMTISMEADSYIISSTVMFNAGVIFGLASVVALALPLVVMVCKEAYQRHKVKRL